MILPPLNIPTWTKVSFTFRICVDERPYNTSATDGKVTVPLREYRENTTVGEVPEQAPLGMAAEVVIEMNDDG